MSEEDRRFAGIACDACNKSLLVEEAVRYVVDIRVYAAYDPMEITRKDLAEDHDAAFDRILEACNRMSPEELEDQVYKAFRFHLCPGCQKKYLRDPLGERRGDPKES